MIGRTKELQRLNNFYEDRHQRMFVLYGRTGIGKTTLLREFLKEKQGIYFTAYPTTERQEISLMARAIGVSDEGKALEDLLDTVTKLGEEGKVVLVIDHYPNFAKAGAYFQQILHDYVAKKWDNGRVKLVLCGDAYLQMEKYLFAKKSIWKDVNFQKVELLPLDYLEAMEFYPEAGPQQAAEYYGVTGGIPYYLKCVEDTTERTIERIYLAEEAETSLLPEKSIREELRELPYYNRLLAALASGLSRVNQLSETVDKPKDVVVPYLNTLMSIGVVTKENPVTEPTNRRKTRYSIVHSCDRFWYGLIAPRIDLYFKHDIETLFEQSIRLGMGRFMKPVFIQMCRQYLARENEKRALPFYYEKIGNWWENDEEKKTTEGFDLVALGETEGRDAIIFTRCYYRDEPVGMLDLKDMIDLAKKIQEKGAVFYLFFSKDGFEENARTVAATIRNIMLITLEDICKK